ncbi:MAG: 1-deoxy-D-xylulose-5-phosphate synthase [candidate division WOR-3 bacterium]
MSVLERINSPEELRELSIKELYELAGEIRETILDVTSKTGGHVGPSLGVVELTIAIHYIYDSPRDKIIWDVGHQSYAHKILTGRKERFSTLRQLGGLSGFTKPEESPHDPFGAGHASTAISAALGMAIARDMAGEDYNVVAVVGDGALTGGMAMEALNHAGHLKKRITVILNDNERSIAENVGGLSNYLAKLSGNKLYNRVKEDLKELLSSIPDTPLTRKAKTVVWKMKESLKNLMIPTVIFEELGWRYFGPVGGHDIDQLIDILEHVKYFTDGPVVVHVITQKGKGYEPAMRNPELFHGIGPFIRETGEPVKKPGPPTYSEVYGNAVVRAAEKDERVIAITAAMCLGTGLAGFRERFPERLFDVGIAEQHAVTLSAGMAMAGLVPFCTIYSTFLQRAFDQIIHDVALQDAPVRFALDRAGLVGDDGPTHHGVFDIAYMRMIPGMVVMAPKDEDELADMVWTMLHYEDGPISVRYPRGPGTGASIKDSPEVIPIGKWEVLRTGSDVAIIATGSAVYPAIEAAEELEDEDISAEVINARFVKPLDEELLVSLVERGPKTWLTVEEGTLVGGFGSGIAEFLEAHGWLGEVTLKRIGIPDHFITHGTRAELLGMIGLDSKGIANSVKELLWQKRSARTVARVRRRS